MMPETSGGKGKPDSDHTASRIRRHTRTVWAMFMLFPIIQFVIAEQLTVNREMPPSESLKPILIFCIVMSGMAAIAGLVLHHWLPLWLSKLGPRRQSGLLNILSAKTMDSDRSNAGQVTTSISSAVVIVLCCLAVSISMYGMTIVILGGELWNMIPFAAVSLILLVVFRPTEAFFRRIDDKFGAVRPGDTK